jgi:diaminohydroxyphosphoribosylaminopyrimidine deaminase/5-amino-6-(5-phosphoribosylamino)uracil reductase
MQDKHRKYMSLALEIAFSRLGKTSPNPPVGAVIVKNDNIISTGGTLCCGSDHAEIVAIKNAAEDISGADMYVTLEPCCHQSKKTPPCTEALINAKLARVFIPIFDPNPAVSCGGVQRLRDAGIEVVMLDEMSDMAFDLIRQFKKYIQKKKPYIIHKSAMTLDGRIAARSGDSKWISNEYSRFIVHKLRGIVDAVIIGKNTLVKDNPALNVRLNSFPEDIKSYFKKTEFNISGRDSFFLRMLLKSEEPVTGESPLRVVAGLPENINESMNIFFDDNYLFFAEKNKIDFKSDKFAGMMMDAGNVVLLKEKMRNGQVEEILDELYSRGKMLVMLEGGGGIAGSFYDAGEIDQFFYFITPKILGNGLNSINGSGKDSVMEALQLKDLSAVMLKDDILINGYSLLK